MVQWEVRSACSDRSEKVADNLVGNLLEKFSRVDNGLSSVIPRSRPHDFPRTELETEFPTPLRA